MALKQIKSDYQQEFLSEMRFYRDPELSILVGVPDGWVDNSSENLFQVCAPDLKVQFTASMHRLDGVIDLRAWTKIRLSTVDEQMPYLRQVDEVYQVSGVDWIGYAAEYCGTFPDNDYSSKYLVLCLTRGKDLISFTVTAPQEEFEKNDMMYRWLIEKALILESVEVK